MRIAVFLSDKRMELLAARLQRKAEVVTIFKLMDFIYAEKIADQLDAVVLPMSGVDEQGMLKMAGQGFPVVDFLKECSEKLIVFTGTVSPILVSGRWLTVNLSMIPEVKNGNAQLTAQGVLDLLIMKTPCDFHEYTYDVLGYGACGKAVTELLQDNHCALRLISRQDVSQAYPVLDYPHWALSEPADIVINTAAACVINQENCGHWRKKPLIIDLATRGMGVAAELRNQFKILTVPALPALTGPQTAARLLAEAIERELKL